MQDDRAQDGCLLLRGHYCMRDVSGQYFDSILGGSPFQSAPGQSVSGQSVFDGIRGYGVATSTDRWGTGGSNVDRVQSLARLAGDARLAAVFKQIRAVVGVSESEMARRLGADISVILDFEAGAVDAFPPWSITTRLIERYAAMADVDPSPILSRILSLQTPVLVLGPTPPHRLQYIPSRAQQPAVTPPHTALVAPAARPNVNSPNSSNVQPVAYTPPAAPVHDEASVTGRPVGFETRSKLRTTGTGGPRPQSGSDALNPVTDLGREARRRRRLRRSLAAFGLPLALIVAVFALLQTAPRPLYAFAALVPGSLATPVRSLVDLIVTQTAPVKDGLRWIDAGDPRLRKGDRLLVK